MRSKAKAFVSGFLVAVLAILSTGVALAVQPPAATYLALGDSLAVGVGATPVESRFGYVGRFNHWFKDSREGPHGLTNVAVRGETSGSIITGGQLAAAVGAIADPDSDVQMVTLDIGGNDLLGLLGPGGPCAPDPAVPQCQAAVADALGAFSRNYPAILSSVVTALAQDPGVETVLVTTYYNPYDGTGSPFELPVDVTLLGADLWTDCGALGDPANVGLNDLVACIGAGFGAYGVRVVDTYPLFDGNALALTHIAEGDIHPNNAGYAAITSALVASVP